MRRGGGLPSHIGPDTIGGCGYPCRGLGARQRPTPTGNRRDATQPGPVTVPHAVPRARRTARYARPIASALVGILALSSVALGEIDVPTVVSHTEHVFDGVTTDPSRNRGLRADTQLTERGADAVVVPSTEPVATASGDQFEPPSRPAPPTPAPTDPATPAPATAAATPPPATPAPTAAPTSTPGQIAASDPRVGGDYILVSRARLVALPTSGAAWSNMKAAADGNLGSPDLGNMDQDNNVRVLAASLVFARTGDPAYRQKVLDQLKAAIGSEGGSALALAREAGAYALAADFIVLRELDPQFDANVFRPWLRSLLTVSIEGRSLQSTHEERANNWGTHAGASRAAIAAYLGDGAEMARVAQVFRGWVGERSSYAGFSYGELDWQANPSAPVGINPVGASINGINVDGALPEEMRRGGGLQWPPAGTDYPWGALEGATLQAEILHRHGYDAYGWGSNALLRSVRFLFETVGWRPAGNDQWVFWVIDYRYGTGYRAAAPIAPGKNFGWSDWLYGG